jgi:hypothetical protein
MFTISALVNERIDLWPLGSKLSVSSSIRRGSEPIRFASHLLHALKGFPPQTDFAA